MRNTLYKQFVGGEKFESLKLISVQLKEAADIRTMVYVPTEEDVSSESEDFIERSVMQRFASFILITFYKQVFVYTFCLTTT